MSVNLFCRTLVICAAEVNWGSSLHANRYRLALSAAYTLHSTQAHVKTWRPQLLVLSGPPHRRPALVDLAAAFTRDVGLCICANLAIDQCGVCFPFPIEFYEIENTSELGLNIDIWSGVHFLLLYDILLLLLMYKVLICFRVLCMYLLCE